MDRQIAIRFFFAQALSSTVELVSSQRNLDDFSQLVTWINDGDSAIEKPESDAFGHATVAQRIASRLCDDGRQEFPTIAVVGRVGSGKTSIVNLVQYYVAKQHGAGSGIRLVRLSLWPGRLNRTLLP